jgi:hypothetical protein
MNENTLKPELTNEFLSTLTNAAKVCGWNVDHGETTQFVIWCHRIAGQPVPEDLEAFPYE